MSNQMVPFNPAGAPSQAMQQYMQQNPLANTLAEGVGIGFANLSFKGKVFRIKHNGQEVMVVDPKTRTAIPYFDLIIVDAKAAMSKTFYVNGYTEGTTEQPDCASEDGITPFAPAGKQVQCHTCQLCPWNAFGSKKSSDGQGREGKACADTRKLVVVPPQDIDNVQFGGPMLLRVPAASLRGLADWDRQLRAQGVAYFAVITRVTFDPASAFPKLNFEAVQYLDDAAFQRVVQLRQDVRVKEILTGGSNQQQQAAVPALQGQAPTGMATAQAPQPMQPAPAQQYAPQQPPAQPIVQTPPPQVYAQPQAEAPQPVYAQAQQQQQQQQQQQPQAAPPVVSYGQPQQAQVAQPQVAPQIPQYAPQQPQAVPQQYAPPTSQATSVVQQPVYAQPQAPVQAQQYAPPQPVQQPAQPQTAVPVGVLNQVDNLLG